MRRKLTKLFGKLQRPDVERDASQDTPAEPNVPDLFRRGTAPVESASDYSRSETQRRINWGFLADGRAERSIINGHPRYTFLGSLQRGTRLRFVRDYTSDADPNAIILYAASGKLRGVDVGLVPRSLSADFSRFIDAGQRVEAAVHEVGRSKTPWLVVSATVDKIPMAEQIANFRCPGCDQLIRRTVAQLIAVQQIVCPACKGMIDVKLVA